MITSLLTLSLALQAPFNPITVRGLPIPQVSEVETLAIVKPEVLLSRIVVTNDLDERLPKRIQVQFDRMRVLSSNTLEKGSSIIVASWIDGEPLISPDQNLLVIGRATRNGIFQIPLFYRWQIFEGEELQPPKFLDIPGSFDRGMFAYGVMPTNETTLVPAETYHLQIQFNLLEILKTKPELMNEVVGAIYKLYDPSDPREMHSSQAVKPDALSLRMLAMKDEIASEYRASFLAILVRRQVKGSARQFLQTLVDFPDSHLGRTYDFNYDVPDDLTKSELQDFSKRIALTTNTPGVLAQGLKYLGPLPDHDRALLAKWLDGDDRRAKINLVKWLNRSYGGKGVTGWDAPDLDEAVAYWKGVLGG